MTIYNALVKKLGRHPSNKELKAEVDRIKREAYVEAATKGKLSHQKRKNPSQGKWIKVKKIRFLPGNKLQVIK